MLCKVWSGGQRKTASHASLNFKVPYRYLGMALGLVPTLREQ